MSREKDFARELDRLFHRRTAWLRQVLGRRQPGLRPKLKRHHRDRAIEKLQAIAAEALTKNLARQVLADGVRQKRSWRVSRGKGYFRDERPRAFNDWYQRKIGQKSSLYVFWSRRGCVYVGKTTRGGNRPSSHFEKYWFQPVRRIDVYATRGRRPLPAMECIAMHRFQPTRNKVKAAAKRWTPKCPLCTINRNIRDELRDIFRLV